MSEIGPVICQLDPTPRVPHSLILTPVDVHLGVREVGKATGVIKVEVRHYDVPDGFRCVAEAGHLAHGGALRVVLNSEIESEEADHGRRAGVVVKPEASVYEHRALIGLREQAGAADVPAWEPGGHWRAVENVDGHAALRVCSLVS
jgi:hypothetical protein